MVLDEKSSQEYPVNAGVPQWSILGPTLFLLYINNLRDDVADDTPLYCNCDQASDLWQQLEIASELESDPRDTVDQITYPTSYPIRSGLLISVLGKLSWFRLTGLITMVLLM